MYASTETSDFPLFDIGESRRLKQHPFVSLYGLSGCCWWGTVNGIRGVWCYPHTDRVVVVLCSARETTTWDKVVVVWQRNHFLPIVLGPFSFLRYIRTVFQNKLAPHGSISSFTISAKCSAGKSYQVGVNNCIGEGPTTQSYRCCRHDTSMLCLKWVSLLRNQSSSKRVSNTPNSTIL